MSSIFRTVIFRLEDTIVRRESFSISKTAVKFQNSYFYNPVLLEDNLLEYYTPDYALGEENIRNTKTEVSVDYDILNALLNVRFKQG